MSINQIDQILTYEQMETFIEFSTDGFSDIFLANTLEQLGFPNNVPRQEMIKHIEDLILEHFADKLLTNEEMSIPENLPIIDNDTWHIGLPDMSELARQMLEEENRYREASSKIEK